MSPHDEERSPGVETPNPEETDVKARAQETAERMTEEVKERPGWVAAAVALVAALLARRVVLRLLRRGRGKRRFRR